MNNTFFSRTAATSLFMGLAMAVWSQETRFLSSNHCIYRIDNSQKVLLLPVQEKAEMCNVKVVDSNNTVKTFNVRLASNHIDYYVPLYLGDYKDSKALSLDIHVNGTYRNDGELSGFTCWKNMKYADSFDTTNREQYRPAYHHTPAYGWMNDPNGMFYKDGVWHLYYQHNPYGSQSVSYTHLTLPTKRIV